MCGVLQVQLQLLGPFFYHKFIQMYYEHSDNTFLNTWPTTTKLMLFSPPQQSRASNSVWYSDSIFGTTIISSELWPLNVPDQNQYIDFPLWGMIRDQE
jgi:hypothetical protein